MTYKTYSESAEGYREFSEDLLKFIRLPAGRGFCEECGGSGSVGTEQRYTDPTYDGSETQWRGYLPTNYCHICNGTGVWPPLEGGRK